MPAPVDLDRAAATISRYEDEMSRRSEAPSHKYVVAFYHDMLAELTELRSRVEAERRTRDWSRPLVNEGG